MFSLAMAVFKLNPLFYSANVKNSYVLHSTRITN